MCGERTGSEVAMGDQLVLAGIIIFFKGCTVIIRHGVGSESPKQIRFIELGYLYEKLYLTYTPPICRLHFDNI